MVVDVCLNLLNIFDNKFKKNKTQKMFKFYNFTSKFVNAIDNCINDYRGFEFFGPRRLCQRELNPHN